MTGGAFSEDKRSKTMSGSRQKAIWILFFTGLIVGVYLGRESVGHPDLAFAGAIIPAKGATTNPASGIVVRTAAAEARIGDLETRLTHIESALQDSDRAFVESKKYCESLRASIDELKGRVWTPNDSFFIVNEKTGQALDLGLNNFVKTYPKVDKNPNQMWKIARVAK